MRRLVAMGRLAACLAGSLALGTSAAHADPISSPYLITDLGSSGDSNDWPSISNGTVTGPNGMAYPFASGPTMTQLTASQVASLPVPMAPPPTGVYGGPSDPNTSSAINAFQLPNGTVIAIDQVVQNNGTEYQDYIPYVVQQNANGTWGTPQVIGSGFFHEGPDIGGGPYVSVMAADNVGDFLVKTQSQAAYYESDFTVTNILNHTTTDISTLPVLVNNGYSNINVVAMDGNGQLLLSTPSGIDSEDWLLLTPAGSVNAPEPASLAVMALAMAAFAAHRARARRAAG